MVGVASSADEALRFAQTHRPDVDVVDVKLAELTAGIGPLRKAALCTGAIADLLAEREQREPGPGPLHVS